jgi:hypothetical protein
MTEQTWMKEPCGRCPYTRTNTLWLHPERAEDFAYNAANPYNDFPCHKTAELAEDDEGCGEYVFGRKSLTCCGFLSLQVNENGRGPKGFEPHPDAFGEAWEMIDHHADHWEQERECRAQVDRNPEGGNAVPSRSDESAVVADDAPKGDA